MRGLRTIPVLLDMCRDMEELCPDVLFLNYTNPMAMNCLGDAPGDVDPDGRAVPQRAGHRARAGPTTSACRSTRSTTSAPASTTWPSTCASSATARTSTRDLQAHRRSGRGARPGNRVRYEMLQAARLLRHRVERALHRVRALVHQARPARPDRALQHPARRVPAPLRGPDRRLGARCARRCISADPAALDALRSGAAPVR